jgi:hypothetical protein
MRLRRFIGLSVLAAAAAAAEPPQPLDLTLNLEARHLQDTYLEEIEVIGEKWREPAPDADEWRPQTRTWEAGRITWGYDSVYEDMNEQRESRLYLSEPASPDDSATSTIFRVRF